MSANTTGGLNSAYGYRSLYKNTTGGNNAAFGVSSGQFTANKITEVTATSNSVFLGRRTSPLGNSQTNQIVIGDDANGLGSNTTVLGNVATVFSRIWGRILLGTSTDNGVDALQVNGTANILINSYSDDAAADADTNLKSKTLYKITGSRVVYQKP